MTVALQVVRDVPIVSTGTYPLARGRTTFSEEDLADAVAASHDATVPAPRLKLGHTDPRFEEAFASADFDGEPAFGTATNLRLSDDRQTIIGDYTNVPSWLADTIASSYPSRSIEGAFGFTAASGRRYRLAIANVALLGVTWPGVTSLADLRGVLEQNGAAETVDASSGVIDVAGGRAERFVTARTADRCPVTAGIDLGVVQRQFVQDLDGGRVPSPPVAGLAPQGQWWPRSVRSEDDGFFVIADDADGHLIRVPFSIDGSSDLTYGVPELVEETYTPVAASSARVLASWQTRAASRPSTTTEVTTMQVDPAVLRKRLGLSEDADDAAITEALTKDVPALAPPPVAASIDPEDKDPEKPVTVIPEGMVLLDAETLQALKDGAEKGSLVAARFASQERDDTIEQAISKRGRISASARKTWQERWDRDPEGTRTLLTADVTAGGLPDNTIPVAMREIGSASDGDQTVEPDADHEAFMARYNPQIRARMSGRDKPGLRVRTEV